MASNVIIKGVSKKLRHYMEVKRLEDGFDLSNYDSPKLDHPPLKSRPTLLYDGLHDRSLKHYYHIPVVRNALTKMELKDNKETRRIKEVNKDINILMAKTPMEILTQDPGTKKLGQQPTCKKPDKGYHSLPYLLNLGSENFWSRDLNKKDLGIPLERRQSDLYKSHYKQKATGAPLPNYKRKPGLSMRQQGYPVLRTVPSKYITRGEAERLIKVATKLLVATELYDLDGDVQSLPKVPTKKISTKTPERTPQKPKKQSGPAVAAQDSYGSEGNKLLRVKSKKSLTQNAPETNGVDGNVREFHDACAKGDLARLDQLLAKKESLKTDVNEKSWAPLLTASYNGQTEIVKWLAVVGVDMDVQNKVGHNAMHLASMQGHTDTMFVLAAWGTKLSTRDDDQNTPLHFAAMFGHLDSVKWLVANRAPIQTYNENKKTPAKLAAENNHSDIVEFIEKCLKDKNNPESNYGQISLQDIKKQEEGKEHFPMIRKCTNANNNNSDESDSPGQSMAGRVGSMAPASDSSSTTSSSSSSSSSMDDETPRLSPAQERKKSLQIEEKRKLYSEQQKKMSERRISFLDSIRDEFEDK